MVTSCRAPPSQPHQVGTFLGSHSVGHAMAAVRRHRSPPSDLLILDGNPININPLIEVRLGLAAAQTSEVLNIGFGFNISFGENPMKSEILEWKLKLKKTELGCKYPILFMP
ncbi:hypothetical protein L1049_011615 [Liquidambar formosana]|uniref:Uncharacterized protein n=1 Tax=Liquidambar formosana TaxID=63359 RepID=A0AAP0X2D7_LIQFO